MRIRPADGSHPKCLIVFNGSDRTILDHQIESLFFAGVKDIGIVVGYEKNQIVRHVTRRYWGSLYRFKFIDNAEFAETNNIYSLWLARNWLKGDSFVCLNAEVAFDPAVLPPALSSASPITMIVDRAWRDKTMKVIIAGDRITRMGKQISRKEFSATYIGITAFNSGIVDQFLKRIHMLVLGRHDQVFLHSGVQQLADDGVRVGYVETTGLPWAEIDDPGDLALARLYVFPKLAASQLAA
jgi:choline kinase